MSTRRLALWIGLPLAWLALAVVCGVMLSRPQAKVHAGTEAPQAPLIAVTPEAAPSTVAAVAPNRKSAALTAQPLIQVSPGAAEPPQESQPVSQADSEPPLAARAVSTASVESPPVPHPHRRHPRHRSRQTDTFEEPAPATVPVAEPVTQKTEAVDEPTTQPSRDSGAARQRRSAPRAAPDRQIPEPIGEAVLRARRLVSVAGARSASALRPSRRHTPLVIAARRRGASTPEGRDAQNWRSRFFADSDFRDER